MKSFPIQTAGLTESQINAIASGSTLGLQQSLLANAGQPALTVLAVGYVTSSGKVQGVSLGDGNVVQVYSTGADFNSGTVLYREFMNRGEPICFTGLSIGAIITSTAGFYGFCENLDDNDESPMPLLSYGLSFTNTFFFGFRNCNNYRPGGSGDNNDSQGWVHVVAGPLKTLVSLKFGDGSVVQGQENIEVQPWSYLRLYTDGNTEYILEGTNPIMACHNANMDLNPQGRFYDNRLIMPLTNDGITWPRSGNVSAPFDNTLVNYYVRDGASGNFTVSPGSPVDFDNATGATDSDYEPDGATRVLAVGLISAYSGADSAGLEASPLMPTSAMSQVVAQPLFIDDQGDGGNSGIAIASPYEGSATVYEWNFTTSSLDVAYVVPLLRNNVTVTTRNDQNHPAAGQVANETTTGSVLLDGDLNPGIIIADVPITVVVQSNSSTFQDLRSQNGTTASPIINDDDETLSLGYTPPELKAEIVEATDGLLYKRTVEGIIDTNPEQGFIDYNDSTGGVAIVADTWTSIPNDGAGAFSNDTHKPTKINQLLETTTGQIDPTELDLGDTILIRNDYSINPNTNNAELEFRYVLGSGASEYTLETTIGRLDDGSGKDYRFSLKPDLIYMGDTNTRDNLITLQIKLSSNGTLTNAGTVIQVIKKNVHGAEKWIKA